MTAEKRPIFNPNSEVLKPYSNRDPKTLGDLTPLQRWQLKNKEAELKKRPTTGDGAIQRMLDGGNIMWEILEPEGVAQILHGAATELEIPASMFRSTDLEESLDMLGGRTLIGLFKYVLRHTEREGQPVMPFLMQQAGIEVAGQDIADAMKKRRQPEWGHIPSKAIGEILELAAQELDKPVHMLKTGDFTKQLGILGGRSLVGLYKHFDAKEERDEKDTVNFILEKVGIEMDVFNKMRSLGNVAFFDQASWDEIGDILRKVAEELGKPVSLITANEIQEHNTQFLGGRTIRELRSRMNKDGISMTTLIDKVGDNVSSGDVIEIAKAGRSIVWNRIPLPVVKDILEMAANERGKPASLLTEKDLDSHFSFLEGKTFGGLHSYISKKDRPDNRFSIGFLLDQAGIYITAENILEGRNKNLLIHWDRVSWAEVGRLFEVLGAELGIPRELIGAPEMKQNFDCLNGTSMFSLYMFARAHEDKDPNETTLSFIRRKTGIEDGRRPKNSTRLKFRAQKMETLLQEAIAGEDTLSSVDTLLPSIHSIARLYANPFLEIEPSEIESEAIIYTLEFMSQNKPVSEFNSGLNAHLEKYVTNASKPKYREQLLSAPTIVDSKLTLGDMISSTKQEDSPASHENLNKSLASLSPFQQELVMKIAVDERNIEDLSEELGIDTETLQDMYYDCLTTLKAEITKETP